MKIDILSKFFDLIICFRDENFQRFWNLNVIFTGKTSQDQYNDFHSNGFLSEIRITGHFQTIGQRQKKTILEF